MGLMTEQTGPADEYEAVPLPAPDLAAGTGSAVFLRRSQRPSRRAVLHLIDLAGSFAPADLARWYNERGFHFYVTDLEVREPHDALSRKRSARSMQACFEALDAACAHLRQADGIDAIILSAQDSAVTAAALWCDARKDARQVDALILSSPEFGRPARRSLDIACPVLVISAQAGQAGQAGRRERRSREAIRLGQHVTWLHLQDGAASAEPTAAAATAATATASSAATAAAVSAERRRLFDEMGRWLGAYMYGQVRDQLL